MNATFAAHWFDSAPFGRGQIDGRFSLVDRGPLAIEAVPGLVLRVRKGSLRAMQRGNAHQRLMRAGASLVSERAGMLVLSALERTELQLEWPRGEAERLSPGLEPLVAAY